MSIKPIHDWVMIRRLPDKQIGHIVIPDNVDTKPRIGIVEAVGPGRLLKDGTREPMDVKVGDRVSFSLASGYVTALPGQALYDTRLLIRETDVLAILDDDSEASALGSPWPAFITEGPQDSSDA